MVINESRVIRVAAAHRDWERVAYHFKDVYPVNARDARKAAEARYLREEAAKDGIDLDKLIEQSKGWA